MSFLKMKLMSIVDKFIYFTLKYYIMKFDEIFLSYNELKSVEKEIIKISEMLKINPNDLNLQNKLSNLKINRKDLLEEFERSKENYILCKPESYNKNHDIFKNLNESISKNFEYCIGKQYIVASLKNVQSKEKNRLLNELVYISTKIPQLMIEFDFYHDFDILCSDVFLGYIEDMVKIDLIKEIGANNKIEYSLTDFGTQFITNEWAIDYDLINQCDKLSDNDLIVDFDTFV